MEDIKNTETTESSAVDSNKETTNETNVATEPTKEKTFTQDDVDKLIARRLERERKKAEEEKAEVERLAKMSEAERQNAIYEKKVAELNQKEESIRQKSLEVDMITELAKRELNSDCIRFLKNENEETYIEGIDSLEKLINAEAERRVQKRFTMGHVPPASSKTTVKNPWSREHLNLTEQAKIFKENPTLANQLKASANK
ncbi:DUF4355 domain-containing protein [Clostridium sp.]|uniref:capsid assembly scaffolding protein Gp46 family protein n=1 Tax=Clostridium sp. TaxID=1506 RepID=UPI003217A6A1